MLWHYSHCGSLLANSSPPPWLIKLSFVETRRNSLASWEGVPAPGESTCYSGWLIHFTVRGRLMEGAQLAGLLWHLEERRLVVAGAWCSCLKALRVFGERHTSLNIHVKVVDFKSLTMWLFPGLYFSGLYFSSQTPLEHFLTVNYPTNPKDL